MKKISFLIILTLVIQTQVISQSCLADGIIFNSQESIDNFPTNYPNCTEIEGNVWIANEGITNLDGLSVLTSIGGHLMFWGCDNTSLSLSGLSNLTTIGDDLLFYSTPLSSLIGLNNLTSIGRDLYIYECYNLTSLSGLQNITFIGRDITIQRSNLNNLSGLNKVSNIGGDFEITQTALINLAGLDNLNSIGGSIKIKGNTDLENLIGLSNLTNVGEDFIIKPYQIYQGNSSLINLSGLDNLISIGRNFRIEGSEALTSLSGLNNLRNIGGQLWLEENEALTSLNGLNKLDTIYQGMYLIHNEAISSISALEKLTVLGYIWIQYSNHLKSLTGIENVNPALIYKILLTDNDSLSTCEVESVCSYLELPDAQTTIMRNGQGCSSKIEIELACEAADIRDLFNISYFTISPNPAKNEIFISSDKGITINEINIYNQLGQKVLQEKEITQKIDISMLRHGLYIVEIVSNIKMRHKLIINE